MVRIGDVNVTRIEGAVGFTNASDARFKYNVQSNVPGLDFINKLKPVSYYFDTEGLDKFSKTGVIDQQYRLAAKNQIVHTGFLAQDVEKISKELDFNFDGLHAPDSNKDHYSLAYSQFVMPLVKGMQEQQQLIEELKTENNTLKSQISSINAQLLLINAKLGTPTQK